MGRGGKFLLDDPNADELGELIGTQYDSITSKLMVMQLKILSNK